MLGTLCTLITALAYISCQKVVTQTPLSLPVKTTEKATLNCNIAKHEGYYVSWYKQIPLDAPQFVLKFYHSHSSPDAYGTGISSDHVTSKASSTIDYQLLISNVVVEDSATYYCATWDSTANEWVFGQGTKLIVTDSALPAASLTLFPPSSAELQADRVSVVCVAEDLPTGFAEVSWAVSGNPVSSGISTGSPQQQPNKKFRLSSLLTIQTADWTSDKDVSCQVASASSTASKSIKQSDCSN
ncbi:immunoglobulin lambda-1 light chain-like [Alosa sapidissima]|uniref:immunoglobulin lambda-1 light chain-like n=1 Tax=Alosa sapidissima TaxID=34773 RepID=UPI001C081FA2|nr:immunoglobulin lambda-1 light chain-like [Alosa sapidissima]